MGLRPPPIDRRSFILDPLTIQNRNKLGLEGLEPSTLGVGNLYSESPELQTQVVYWAEGPGGGNGAKLPPAPVKRSKAPVFSWPAQNTEPAVLQTCLYHFNKFFH